MQKRNKFLTFCLLVLSAVMCSVAVNWIAIPNGFVVTGITGLSLTLAEFIPLHYAIISYAITGIVLLCTFIILGAKEVVGIIFLSVLYPAVLYVTSYFKTEIIFSEKLIAVAVFGIVYGVGAGISYRLGFSYGGTDTVGKLLKSTIFKTVQLKTILYGIDFVIMAIMLSVFSLDAVAYALVSQFLYIGSMNYVIFNRGPKLYEIQIICNEPAQIETFIINDIKKSFTKHQAMGGYTKEEKTQIDCVCTSKEYIKLREFIKGCEVDCFIKVFPLTHVFGQNKDFLKIGTDMVE